MPEAILIDLEMPNPDGRGREPVSIKRGVGQFVVTVNNSRGVIGIDTLVRPAVESVVLNVMIQLPGRVVNAQRIRSAPRVFRVAVILRLDERIVPGAGEGVVGDDDAAGDLEQQQPRPIDAELISFDDYRLRVPPRAGYRQTFASVSSAALREAESDHPDNAGGLLGDRVVT